MPPPPPPDDFRRARAALSDVATFGLALAARAAPFASHAAVSAAAYASTLAGAQALGFGLRLSCASRLAPLVGALAVAAASAAAGQASAGLARWRRSGGGRDSGAALFPPLRPFSLRAWAATVQAEDVALDVLLGGALFVASGGRFRSLLPSDVARVGALARESIPATLGANYASETQRAELKLLFKRHGCHHCGAKRGNVIADHQPPNKTVYGSSAARTAAAAAAVADAAARKGGAGGGVGRVAKRVHALAKPHTFLARMRHLLLRLKPRSASPKGGPFPPQRFYPQCVPCSGVQADAMRTGATKLVAHHGGLQPYGYAGTLVGMRYFTPPVEQRKH